ncbi:MAG: hypothetical protein GYA22_07680 [Bacteroidales bacterium]|nr:hypothetical protein [Bacteroidales bacterium]
MKTQPVSRLLKFILLVLMIIMPVCTYSRNNFGSVQEMAPADSLLAFSGYQSLPGSDATKLLPALSDNKTCLLAGHGMSNFPALKLSLGFGFPELVYAGVQGYRNTFQIGAGAGTLPGYDHSVFSVFVQGGYHFGGKSRHNLIPPWYARAILSYGYEKSTQAIWHSFFLSPRIGRNFYFIERLGMDLDIGLSFELWEKKIEKNPSNWNFDFDFPVVPTISISFFYLMKKAI